MKKKFPKVLINLLIITGELKREFKKPIQILNLIQFLDTKEKTGQLNLRIFLVLLMKMQEKKLMIYYNKFQVKELNKY